MRAEQWRPIPLAPGYEASDRGRIRSFRRGAPPEGRLLALAPKKPGSDYRVVRIHYADKWQVRLVHQLVLEAFVGPRPEGARDVRHLNDVKNDNRLANLAWGTAAENMRDRVLNGLHHYASRTSCSHDHPYTPENTVWVRRKNGQTYRQCRTCRREVSRRHKAKVRADYIASRELRAA